jgi:hypothetical protein
MTSNTVIQHKRSSIPGKIPTVNQLVDGELSINTHDGKMYFKRNANGDLSIVEIGSGSDSSVSNVLYVSKSGNNTSNDGRSMNKTFATIAKALSVATSGTTIFVKSGDYTEANPLVVPAGVSIIGDNLRTTTIRPSTTNQDLFHVNNGCYITGFTFRDHVSPAAAIAFPTAGAGNIITSPYIQNCSSITTTGTGMRIDGSKATGLRSMVSDSFTQINAGGIGVHILNNGYAQLVSIFTVFCDIAILCESGGQCSVTNSNSSFGNYGLKANGTSSLLYDGTVSANVNPGFDTVTITGMSVRPNYGDAIKFGSHGTHYTVVNTTPLVANTVTITLDTSLSASIFASNTALFYQRSLITSSGHTFEYVGSGTNVATALPYTGGIPIQENEIVDDSDGRGKVFYTSTDQLGDFRVGNDLIFNRASGTITGDTFDRSLFAVLTPYILAIES